MARCYKRGPPPAEYQRAPFKATLCPFKSGVKRAGSYAQTYRWDHLQLCLTPAVGDRVFFLMRMKRFQMHRACVCVRAWVRETSKTNVLFQLVRLSQALVSFQRALWKIGRWGTGDKGRPAILLGASPRLVPRQKPKHAQWAKTPKPLTVFYFIFFHVSSKICCALHFRCLMV